MKWLMMFAFLLMPLVAPAKEVVRVGVYDFPPYAFVSNKVTGVTVDMIEKMNGFQQEYEFVIVPTTAQRRYKDFNDKKFDMLIFESKSWGWLKHPMSVSRAFLTGAEIYVAKVATGRDQGFFSNFKKKAMIGVGGYHYGFARFHSERAYMEKNFNIVLTENQHKCLEALMKGRGEIAVLSRDYLNYHFERHPEDRAKLLLSEKIDQTYRHTILLRNNMATIGIRDINRMIEQMKRQGTLEPLWKESGLGQYASKH